jgi:hypothetical protein
MKYICSVIDVYLPESNEAVLVFSLEDSTPVERFITGVSLKLSESDWVYAGIHVLTPYVTVKFIPHRKHTLKLPTG